VDVAVRASKGHGKSGCTIAHMLGEEEDTGRFAYLFEPLDGGEAGADIDDVDAPQVAQPDLDHRWSGTTPNRSVLVAVVLTAMAAVAATVILLLQRSEPADQVDAPIDSASLSTTASNETTPPALVSPPTVTATVTETSEATAIIESEPPPQPEPSTARSEPEVPMTRSPTTRPPISVRPESRPPFPNQNPPEDGEQPPEQPPGLPGPVEPPKGHRHGGQS
jgi:hypothetical protein